MSNEEIKKESVFKKPWMKSIIGIVIIVALLGGFLFWQSTHNTISIEDAVASAPIITLSPTTAGTLNTLYVKEGDKISANTPVALVGTDTITSKLDGIIVSANNSLGELFTPGTPVVSMIHPDDMRIVGTIDENKGLSNVAVGDPATFTVDAFGNKIYTGVVDSISPTADSTSVVFSISDERPTQKFDVKVKFDVAKYPEIKNGMSAKITVYTK